MRQGWIQIAGLVSDIAGFLLIVSEWWNAVIRERATGLLHTARRYEQVAAELAASTARNRLGQRALNYLMLQLLEQKDRAITRAQQLEAHDPIMLFRRRLRNFLAGAALVVLGFMFQVLSAIPGGLPGLGIVP
jgi:hypothetical protein